ncbi:glycosyltransferase family 4 protein [Xylanibacter muris]|uniref:Glycosyltransferase family 4 protein n=1 Tax=Xylanibacter muris TaxID=2736290 RepID=A0ABX2AIM1_9BACT|nr:glycosyltransferase family 4 protein [Xylanibacter muris]NPD90889.1 glycosyltransferase family 4 protein [Xylanibacter muris]
MKIAMVTDHLLSGGKERRMVELMKVLSKNPKYEFTVVLLEGKDDSSIAYRDILYCPVRFVYLGQYNRRQLIWQFYSLCKKEKFDLIHLWAALVYGYILAPTHYMLKTPIISSSITSARKQGGNKFRINKFTYNFYDKVLSNSKQAFVINEVPEDKAICIYNGFNPERLQIKTTPEEIRKRYGIKTSFIVSMAGEYSKRKDYPLFVNAANRVLQANPDVTFIAMGSGDSVPYEALVEKEFKDRIKFVGRVTDVESVYNASDVVVLATMVEGVSNAIMEGMSLGKPIVSTYGPYVGTAEIVEDNRSGFLVKYHDVEAFADRIIRLLNDDLLRKEMGERGCRIVKDKFNIKQMVDGFAMVYDNYDM